MWLTRPFDGAGAPAHGQAAGDGVEVLLQALAKEEMPGGPASRAPLIHCGRSWPVSWVSMAANARIWAEMEQHTGDRITHARLPMAA